MDIPDLYKRRPKLNCKEGEIPKIITKTNASLIVTSARESLKQSQLNKQMYFPAPRKISANSLTFLIVINVDSIFIENIPIAKLNSPCTAETRDSLTIDGITVARAHSKNLKFSMK